MVKAILFDLDNTLIDFMRMKKKSCEAAVDAMIDNGLNMKKEEIIGTLYNLYDKYGLESQKIFQKLLKKLHGKIDYRILAAGIIEYRKVREIYLIPYPGVISTLTKLKKKYKLGIVSDASSINAWIRLIKMKLDDFFYVVVTKSDVKKQKNYSAPFNSALKQLKMKPKNVLMVGDRIGRDIVTPKKIGIKTCFARYGSEKLPKSGTSGADFEINDIKELINVLEKF